MGRHQPDGKDQRRRNVIRTALILLAVVVLIYVAFVGQGLWRHFT